MQTLKAIKSKQKFPLFDLLLFIGVFGYVDYQLIRVMPIVFSWLNEILNSSSIFITLIDIVLLAIFIFAAFITISINYIVILGMLRHIRLIGFEVFLLDDGIKFRARSREAFVPYSSIKHISTSSDKRYLFIVWKALRGEKSFCVSRRIFGEEGIKEIDSILSKCDAYVHDTTESLEIRKGLEKFKGNFYFLRNPYDIEDGV